MSKIAAKLFSREEVVSKPPSIAAKVNWGKSSIFGFVPYFRQKLHIWQTFTITVIC